MLCHNIDFEIALKNIFVKNCFSFRKIYMKLSSQVAWNVGEELLFDVAQKQVEHNTSEK